MATNLIGSFNGGEQADVLDWRLDPERAKNACRKLENFMPLVTGGVVQRPPTELMGKTLNGFTKLIPFNFSTSTREMLAIGRQPLNPTIVSLMAFSGSIKSIGTLDLPYAPRQVQHPEWSDPGNPITCPIVTPSETVTDPFDELEFAKIQHCQDDDLIRLTHPTRPPMELRRRASMEWEAVEFAPEYFPLAPYQFGNQQEGYNDAVVCLANGGAAVVATGTFAPTAPVYEAWAVQGEGLNFVGTIEIQRVTGTAPNYPPIVPTTGFVTISTTVYTTAKKLNGPMVLVGDALCNSPTTDVETPYGHQPSWVRLKITRTSGSLLAGFALVARSHPVGRGDKTTLTCLETTPVSWDDPDDPNKNAVPMIRVRANARIFTPEHAMVAASNTAPAVGGAYLRIEHQRPDARIVLSLAASGTSSTAMTVQGDCNVLTLGTWHGTLYIESLNPKSIEWETEASIFRNGQSNASQVVTVDGVRSMRLRFVDAAGTPSGTPQAILTPLNNRAFGLLRIRNVVNGFFAYCEVVNGMNPFSTQPTTYWQEGAWSRARGYPTTSAVFEQRVVMAGTPEQPTTLWMSETNEPNNFHLGTSKDTDPLDITLDSARRNRVIWLASQQSGMLVGTTGSEWILSASADGAISPTNRRARSQTEFGSAEIKAVRSDEVVIFAQRGGFVLRESSWAFENDRQNAVSLSVFADHLFRSGVRSMDYASQPIGSLWCLMNDATCAVLTYERQQGVVAWWKFITQGGVESVAVNYGDDGLADEVWLSVNRGGVRFIERVIPTWWRNLNTRAAEQAYVDCRISGQSIAAIDLAGWSGLTTWGVHKTTGEVRGPFTGVPSGAQVPRTSDWFIGLGYEAAIMPMRTDLPLPTGTAQGKRWRVSGLDVMLWNSANVGEYRGCGTGSRGDLGEWNALPTVDRIDPPGQAGPLYTGIIPKIPVSSRHGYGVDWEIRNKSPRPLNILAAVPTFESYG